MSRRKRDGCQFCLGAKGGAPGNEVVVNGVTCCDECLALVQVVRRRKTWDTLPPVRRMVTKKPKGVAENAQTG